MAKSTSWRTGLSKTRKYPMIQVTLTAAVQSKLLLPVLSKIGIHESYPEPHVIAMKPHIFGLFMAEIAAMDDPPTVKQLQVERIDLLKLPRRTIIKYEKMPYEDVSIIGR